LTHLRKKESTLLETETAQMAERLQALRDQMVKEKETRDANAAQKVRGCGACGLNFSMTLA